MNVFKNEENEIRAFVLSASKGIEKSKLIDELSKLNPNQPVYLGNEDTDGDTYYYQLGEVIITKVDGIKGDVLIFKH